MTFITDDYKSKINSNLRKINGDGDAIKNILDVFESMSEKIEKLEKENNDYMWALSDKEKEINERVKQALEENAEKKYKEKVAQLKTAIWAGIRKYIDEEINNVSAK